MPRGIFRLKQVYEEQLSGQWSTRGDVWNVPSPFSSSGPAPFGYIGGGYAPDFCLVSLNGPFSTAVTVSLE